MGKSCENCGNYNCFVTEPEYKICKNGSLWTPKKSEKTIVYVVSYTQINDDNEIDYAAVEKVFFSKTAAEEYKAKREAETWGADYSVDEMEVE